MQELDKSIKPIEQAAPGDYLNNMRILEIKDGLFTVRKGRSVAAIKPKTGQLVYDQSLLKTHPHIAGQLYHYSYSRGREYQGIALIRGNDGFESWLWSIDAWREPVKHLLDEDGYSQDTGGWFTNHFGHRNFVIHCDEHWFKPISVEMDLALGNL